MEDIVEFTEKIVEVIQKDEENAKKAKKTKTTLTLALKNGEDVAFTIVIDYGKISFSRQEIPDAEFKIEMSKQSYEDLLDGKVTGMKMMKVIKIVKGSLMGMRKLDPIFENLPKITEELKEAQMEMVA